MPMENLLRRVSRATMFAGAVVLVSAHPAHAAAIPVGGTSNTGPAAVEFEGQLCVAWSGVDSSHHLNIACGDPNVGSFQTVVTDQLSAFTPALAVYHGALWMAWTGTDSNHTLNIAQVNPFTGSTSVSLEAFVVGNNDASSQGPALAVANVDTSGNPQLVIAWTGTDSHHHLNVASSLNVEPSNTWNTTITLNQLASGGPSLATFDNTLYMGWAGTDSHHTLNLASAALDTLSFGTARQINFGSGNFTSSSGPSLTSTANLNYGWLSADVDIAFYATPANTSVAPTFEQTSFTTGASPALTTFNGALWVVYIGGGNALQMQQP
jgi:hypothetical protein